MAKTKQTKQRHRISPNPFRRGLVAIDHPAPWIMELILVEVERQIAEKEQIIDKENISSGDRGGDPGTFPGKHSTRWTKHVPENVPDRNLHAQSKANKDKDKINTLKQRIKDNIANCRYRMVKEKNTPSFRGQDGSLPAGRGWGKLDRWRVMLRSRMPSWKQPSILWWGLLWMRVQTTMRMDPSEERNHQPAEGNWKEGDYRYWDPGADNDPECTEVVGHFQQAEETAGGGPVWPRWSWLGPREPLQGCSKWQRWRWSCNANRISKKTKGWGRTRCCWESS